MVAIRQAQIEAFQADARRRFERTCLELIATTWSDVYRSWTEEELLAELRALFAAAKEWGFHTERELYRLTNAACLLGLGFQRAASGAWAVRTLADERMPPDAKIAALLAGAAVRQP